MRMSNRRRWGLLWLVVQSVVGGVLLHAGIYGWTIFVVLPIAMGSVAAWALLPETAGEAAADGAVTATLASFLLFSLGWEGAICIVMTLPLSIGLGAFGAWITYLLRDFRARAGGTTLLLLFPPAFLWDIQATPALFEVRTEVVIAAPPEKVWRHVVSFSTLPEPEEWFFRAGIAYPKRAVIEGSGPGAMRYCEFSTGRFVEPVEIWDEPRLLRFRVTENPPPMHEWSPYAEVLPRHLHGYFLSEQGQFLLTRLPDGGTLLAGTTWYRHGLWPEAYWRLWSDAIIHRIHLRVLRHIRSLAEAG